MDRPRSTAVERAAELLGPAAQRDAPLGPLTTYRVGGSAPRWSSRRPTRASSLIGGRRRARDAGVPVLVVGRGSNLLVADAGFAGLAVVLRDAVRQRSTIDGDRVVRAGGGASLPVVARRTAAAGLTGLEWAVGVPGQRRRRGAHERRRARLGHRRRPRAGPGRRARGPGEDALACPPSELDLGYRHSDLGARRRRRRRRAARPAPATAGAAEALIADIVRWRRANQPGGQNAGSVFTNPPGDAAGRLIDRPASRACASARPRCRPSTPTSSRPTRAARPTTCSPSCDAVRDAVQAPLRRRAAHRDPPHRLPRYLPSGRGRRSGARAWPTLGRRGRPGVTGVEAAARATRPTPPAGHRLALGGGDACAGPAHRLPAGGRPARPVTRRRGAGRAGRRVGRPHRRPSRPVAVPSRAGRRCPASTRASSGGASTCSPRRTVAASGCSRRPRPCSPSPRSASACSAPHSSTSAARGSAGEVQTSAVAVLASRRA